MIEADGSLRTVVYTTDPINGFNAVVEKTPLVHKSVVPVAPIAPVAHALPAPALPLPAFPAPSLAGPAFPVPFGSRFVSPATRVF